MDTALLDWTKATEALDWGVQRAFLDALDLASKGEVHLVYGVDSTGGKPCLVNAVQQMLSHNAISPSGSFPAVVSAFDAANYMFEATGVNTSPRQVSELAAEILLKRFGKIKEQSEGEQPDLSALDVIPYCEPSDEDMQAALDTMCGTSAALDPNDAKAKTQEEMDERALRDSEARFY